MNNINIEFGKESLPAKRIDFYGYTKSTESDDPDFAYTARQIHARSYIGEGFIHDNAIDDSGQIVSDIDKSRGDFVEYYLGSTTEGEPISTLRTIDAAKAGGVMQLPGYQLCETTLSDEGRELLWGAELAGRPIKEISSFGHVPEVSSQAGLELLRHVLQESLPNNELWFFAMVTHKYQTLVHIFGSQAVRKIGDEVTLNDNRIGDVSLTPAVVDTAQFFDDVKEGILHESDTIKRHRMLKYLRNFTEGVHPSTLSNEVYSLVGGDEETSFVDYSTRKMARKAPDEWTRPVALDFARSIDKLYAKRLVDEGKVRTVLNPTWYEEFADMEGAEDSERSGTWFYYPWSESIIHFPDEETYSKMRHIRDRSLVTDEEQTALRGKSALYAGLSVGSHVVEHMVYAGVTSSHILADFDTVSVSNLNRIHAGMPQVGEQKIDILAKKVSELDPYIEQTLLRQGVTVESLEGLVTPPSIIFDEVDNFAAKALLRQYAKEHHIPLIMATDVGYKSIIDIERHDEADIAPFNGRLDQKTIEAMLNDTLSPEARMKITTKLIGLSNASFRLLQAVSDSSLRGLPQLEVTASQGGALATIVARDILLGRDVKSGRHVHDARRAMKLPAEVSLIDGVKILKTFLHK